LVVLSWGDARSNPALGLILPSRGVEGISEKMLAQTLKTLEADDILAGRSTASS
jgi:hypothetical protein